MKPIDRKQTIRNIVVFAVLVNGLAPGFSCGDLPPSSLPS